jgi:hypothetical protein
MSMLTNCTYPTSPWCEGHRTHTYTYIQQWRSPLFSHHVFFFFFLSIFPFFCRISSNNLTATYKWKKRVT